MNYITYKNIISKKCIRVKRYILSEEMKLIKNQIIGLDRTEWIFLKKSIDMYFENSADKIEFEDLSILEMLHLITQYQ